MTLAFGIAGAAVGAAFGNPVLGFAIGVQLGGLLFPQKRPTIERGRIDDARISGSAYGTMIPICYGNTRVGGNCIWASELEERVRKETVGGGSGGGGQTIKTYTYSRSGLWLVCESALVEGISRIWANDKVIYDDGATDYEIEIQLGDDAQAPNAFIEAIEGTGNVPAYKGVVSVLIKDMDLTPFGGQFPNLSFETGDSGIEVTDGFEESDPDDEIDLETHATDQGDSWVKINANEGVFNVIGDTREIAVMHVSAGNYIVDKELPTEGLYRNCSIRATMRVGTLFSAGTVYCGLLGRHTDNTPSATNAGYWFYYDTDAAEFKLLDALTGAAADSYPYVVAPGEEIELELRMVDDDIRGYINGLEVCAITDDTHKAGYMGIMGTATGIPVDVFPHIADPETSFFLSDFTVQTITSEPPLLLSDILDDVMDRSGLDASEYDNTDADQEVLGYMIPNRMSGKDAIASPLLVYGVDLAEVDGEIRAITTGGASQVTIPSDDLGAISSSNQAPERLKVGREPDLDIPSRVDLGYIISTKAFQQGVQSAVRHTKGHVQGAQSIPTALTLTDDQARSRAEEILYRMWLQRNGPITSLGPKYFKYAPGDVITIPVAGENTRCKLTRCDFGMIGEMAIQAISDDDGVSDQPATGGDSGTDDSEVIRPGETQLIAWNGNALQDEHADTVGLYLAAYGGDGWPGCDVHISRDGGSIYSYLESLPVPAVLGQIVGTLGTFETTGILDESNSVLVNLESDDQTLESISFGELLNGENACLIGSEVVQFQTATLDSPGRYVISNLLRGRRGTEISAHESGERFLLLFPEAVVYKALGEDLVGATVYVKGVTIGKTLADAEAQAVVIDGLEFKSYSPADVTGTRDGSENLTIEWKRRTRKGGAMRPLYDVPLSEDSEAYEVDIMDGLSVVRTIDSLSTETASYSAADQTTDGFTPGDPITVRVYQIGRYGRGYAAEATI